MTEPVRPFESTVLNLTKRTFTPSDQPFAELARLLASAPPGPWFVHKPSGYPFDQIIIGTCWDQDAPSVASDVGREFSDLIAAAVNAAPRLLAIEEAAREVVAVADACADVENTGMMDREIVKLRALLAARKEGDAG